MKVRSAIVVMCALWATPAAAADAGAVLALLDKGNLEGARSKCERWEAAASEDRDLREACAQAWFDEVSAADTVEQWGAFRASWSGTSWGDKALVRESDLALSDLGYAATEEQYLAIAERYPDTEAATLARERAGTAAIGGVGTDEQARALAERYPERLADLVRERLSAFVSAKVTPAGVTDIAVQAAAIDPADLTTAFAGRDATGRASAWEAVVKARLERYGALELLPPASGEPKWPLCVDPVDQVIVGATLSGGGGVAFVPGEADPACGDDVVPVLVLAATDGGLSLSGGPGHLVVLDGGVEPRQNAASLVEGERGPLYAVPADRLLTRQIGEAWLVAPFDGGDPWLTANKPPGALPVPAAARLELPPVLTVGPPDEGAALAPVDGGPPGWQVPLGAPSVLPPQVAAGLGYDPARVVSVPPAWEGELPEGAVAIDLRSGSWGELKAALEAVGVSTAGVRYSRLVEFDLDGDATREIIGELTIGGSPAVAVYSKVGARVWVHRLGGDAPKFGGPTAYELAGEPYLAWVADGAIDILWHSGDGLSLRRITR